MTKRERGARPKRCAEPPETLEAARISVRVPEAVKLTGIKRTKLYELIKSGEIEIVKVDTVTLIPIESLKRYIDALRR